MIHLKKLLAVGAAAAIAVSSTTAVAAPLGTGQFVLKDAAAGDVIHVGRSGRRNTAIGLGILGGVLLGGALAGGHHHHPHPHYYVAPPPPPPPPQKCWMQTGPYRGQGYWAYC